MGVREWFIKRSAEASEGKEASEGAATSEGKAKEAETATTRTVHTFLRCRSNPMLLSTVYRCVDLISDSVATLPLETYRIDPKGFKTLYLEHPVYDLLHLEPNELMSKYTFLKTMVVSMLLTGNAYAYIERGGGGRVEQLVFIPPSLVTLQDIPDKQGVYRRWYYVSPYRGMRFGIGGDGWVEPSDMIHVLNLSYDGLVGKSTLTHAAETIGIATDGETNAKAFFAGGGNISGILTVEGPPMKKEQKDQIYTAWEDRVRNNPNGIVVIEGNMDYKSISVSPKDAQLLESRQFSVIDICRFFSVSPVKAFDLSKSSYNTLEASQLSYLSETVMPYLVKIEEELNRKLFFKQERSGVRCEFDTSEFLRTDKTSQAEHLVKMFQIGAITPNEIRRTNNLSPVEGGDQAFVQLNLQPLATASNPKEVDEKIDVIHDNK
jgi:HK97 family phage portal protein